MRRIGSNRLYLAVPFLALAVAAGCVDAMRESGGGEASEVMGEFTSQHYVTRIIGAPGRSADEMARHGGLLMEKMYDVYAGLDDLPLPPGEAMPFWLHLNRREYDRQAALYDFPADITNGFCSTSGEVHVYYRKSGEIAPEATAMHEGFHQYCFRALHYPTPQEVFENVPGYSTEKIPTVPLWLAEGMAMNMESGTIGRDAHGIAVSIDEVGAVNTDRLDHLVRLLNTNRAPSVRSTLNLIMGDQITIHHYAVMWGLVFDLRMATGNAVYLREQEALERAGPEAVRAAVDSAIDTSRPYPYLRWPVPVMGRFLRACRSVWGLDVPALVEACMRGAREQRDFDRQWNRRLTQAALAELERLLADHGETLEEWEKGWRKRMLALHTQVRGGRYVYEEPKGVRDAAGGSFLGNFRGGAPSRPDRPSPGSW
jgi:hypothetical protein